MVMAVDGCSLPLPALTNTDCESNTVVGYLCAPITAHGKGKGRAGETSRLSPSFQIFWLSRRQWHTITRLHQRAHNYTQYVRHQTRMWANAQRDGRPAEYRWRPLFNAAVWLTPTTAVQCSNAANRRNPWKLAGVHQTQTI